MTKKITEQQWVEIKNRIDNGDYVVRIAKDYGITRQSIYSYGYRNWDWRNKKENVIRRIVKWLIKR